MILFTSANNDMIFATLAFTANKVCNITRVSEYHCVAISLVISKYRCKQKEKPHRLSFFCLLRDSRRYANQPVILLRVTQKAHKIGTFDYLTQF